MTIVELAMKRLKEARSHATARRRNGVIQKARRELAEILRELRETAEMSVNDFDMPAQDDRPNRLTRKQWLEQLLGQCMIKINRRRFRNSADRIKTLKIAISCL